MSQIVIEGQRFQVPAEVLRAADVSARVWGVSRESAFRRMLGDPAGPIGPPIKVDAEWLIPDIDGSFVLERPKAKRKRPARKVSRSKTRKRG